ncbi:Der GTPase-activating protein YihI [Shewanella sp. YIC-542]|uniref:Der GTPase-activating protein YihI n=1 Tax=Shewanella mytili TaxID=3377111 RepID=UPI00398EBB54
MTRMKKSRKAGESAPKHPPRSKKSERVIARKKQDSGNKSGSRQNPTGSQATAAAGKNTKDPRIGSKKPVALGLVTPTSQQPKAVKVKLTDEQQLLHLEEDPRLNQLLDMLEEGRDLSPEDQLWLDKQLAKIEALMQKLGIDDLDEHQPEARHGDDDLLDKFDAQLTQLQQQKL